MQGLYLSICQRLKLKLFDVRMLYLFTAIGFTPGGSGPYTRTKKARTVICISKKSIDQRIHKMESKTLKEKIKIKRIITT